MVVLVLVGVLGVALVVLLGYTYGPVLAFVATVKRQRRVRLLFRRLARPR